MDPTFVQRIRANGRIADEFGEDSVILNLHRTALAAVVDAIALRRDGDDRPVYLNLILNTNGQAKLIRIVAQAIDELQGKARIDQAARCRKWAERWIVLRAIHGATIRARSLRRAA